MGDRSTLKLNKTDSKSEAQSTETPKKSGRSKITAIQESDIEEVAAMSQIYFPGSKNVSLEYLIETIKLLYFTHENTTPEVSSLVSRSADGSINGFLGVTPSSFLYKDEKMVAAHSHHLMATEKGRSMLVPMRILQQFLSGSQDFSFADGSVESSKLLWERLGGSPSISNCIYYKVPLRPFSFASRMAENRVPRIASKVLGSFSGALDLVAKISRIPGFNRNKPMVSLLPLTPELLLEALHLVKNNFSVFPLHNKLKLTQLFHLLGREQRYGALHKLALVDDQEGIVGWFIYYAKKRGICEVIQAVSISGKEDVLFDTLTWHAFDQGGIELSGRLMPGHIRSSFTSKTISIPGRMWTLVHSSDPELKLEIQTGNAFLSRLEGDLWLL